MSEEQGQTSKAVIDSDVADSNPEEVDPAGSSSTQKRKLEVKSLLMLTLILNYRLKAKL
jgi:hypothetical protein